MNNRANKAFVAAMAGLMLVAVVVGTANGQTPMRPRWPIEVYNTSKHEIQVAAFDRTDPARLISCQTIELAPGGSGRITPDSPPFHRRPFDDHCGAFEALSLVVSYWSPPGEYAPWGAWRVVEIVRNVPWSSALFVEGNETGYITCRGCP